jgi:hypothetical protein
MRHADYRPHRKVVLVNVVSTASPNSKAQSGITISPQPYLKPNAQYYADVDFAGKIESCLLARLQPFVTQEDRP